MNEMQSTKGLRGIFHFPIGGAIFQKESYRDDFIKSISEKYISSKINAVVDRAVVNVEEVTITVSDYARDKDGNRVKEASGRYQVILTSNGTTLADHEAFEKNVKSIIDSLSDGKVPDELAEDLPNFTITYE